MRFVLHHNDADGRAAAAVAGLEARCTGKDPVRYLEVDYGAPPFASLGALAGDFVAWRDECWVVDFSFPPEGMAELIKLCNGNLVWIDHHVTAIEALNDFAAVAGKREVGRGASLLTWEYACMGREAPLAVKLISDRDCWLFQLGDASRYFHEAFWTYDTRPGSLVWEKWLSPYYQLGPEIEKGKLLYESKQRRLRGVLERLGRVEKLHGTDMSVLTVNAEGSGDLGDAARELGHSVLHAYVDIPQNGTVVRKHSLYSRDVDVGYLAKIRGGGGHKGAAGWIERLT